MKLEKVSSNCRRVIAEISKVIVGKENVLEMIMLGLLSSGHILIEDYPGLAKTMIARSFALTLGCKFKRIQFTPDLLPADITGTYIYDQKTGGFSLRRGPIFTHILLADEINRASPKTQSALLEAMQERQVTLDGKTHKLDEPFVVFATQNPIEFEGVYPLPEAQLDRFLMRLRVGYPNQEQEADIMRRRIERMSDQFTLEKIARPSLVTEMQRAVEQVHVDDDVLGYITEIVQATRRRATVDVGASPRGSLALLKLSRAHACLRGRDYVIPDDVKLVVVPALEHRLILKAESWVKGVKVEDTLRGILEEVPVPKVD
ncbi:MAG: AAA family ATPase [Nitrososphaeria archaeon]